MKEKAKEIKFWQLGKILVLVVFFPLSALAGQLRIIPLASFLAVGAVVYSLACINIAKRMESDDSDVKVNPVRILLIATAVIFAIMLCFPFLIHGQLL